MALSNAEKSKRHYEKNKEAILLAAAARRAACPERQKEIQKKSYQKHAEQRRADAAAWRQANPEKVKEFERQRDKDAQRVRALAWKKRNPEKCKEHSARRRASVGGTLENRIRARIHKTVKSESLKTGGTFLALGYSNLELRAHLEAQFTKGMGWENMGEWHIDHIVPLASFNITGTDCEDFRRAWALTNLRPLWAKENVAKSAKRIFLI